MQTNATIRRESVRSISLTDMLTEKKSKVKEWLNGRSGIFSRMAGFDVTRLTVIRVNGAMACVAVAAICAEAMPLPAMASAVMAAWQVRLLNKSEKGGLSRSLVGICI